MSEDKQKKTGEEENASIMQKRLEGIEGSTQEPQGKQVKHESDMTRKEKRLLEKEKIKGMGLGKKLEYIWMYYKPAIFGVIGAIVLIFVIKDWYYNAKIQDILSIAIVNGGMGETDAWAEEIKASLGSTDEFERVSFILNLNTDETGNDFDYYAQMAFVAQAQAKGIDVLITTEEMCKKLAAQEYFSELSDVLDEETLAVFGDQAEQYYLKLDGGEIQEHIQLAYDPVCVAILVNTENLENTVQWVSSLAE